MTDGERTFIPGGALRRPRAYRTKPAPPSDKPRKLGRIPGLTEAHIQQTVTQFLEADGWRAIRTEHAIERNDTGGFKRRVGEVGMPDYLYLRYYEALSKDRSKWSANLLTYAQVMFIEFKAPGKKADAHQLRWHEQERARGALVLVVSDIDDFIKRWYPQSGMQRR